MNPYDNLRALLAYAWSDNRISSVEYDEALKVIEDAEDRSME